MQCTQRDLLPAGQILVLLPGVAASDHEIPLQAESTSPGARLSWFVDGEFIGTVATAERLWWLPRPVTDEAGLSPGGAWRSGRGRDGETFARPPSPG